MAGDFEPAILSGGILLGGASIAEAVQFALVGAAGYVAPRHMRAIRTIGAELVAAFDPNDSVGIIDSYFPDARFFVEFERFDRYIDKLRRRGEKVDYISICSPNYLHDAHCRFAMRSEADAICEKPLVLNPWNVDGLAEIEEDTGRRVNTILQLRLHPAISALRDKVLKQPNVMHEVDLTYITSRGRWYFTSWKGNDEMSGGIVTNIGVHFFDALHFLFGKLTRTTVHHISPERAAGYLEFERARVRWFLSLDRNDLPAHTPPGQTTFRAVTVDGEDIEFSGGFEDLHTTSYRGIINGHGFSLDDVRPAIETVASIRTAPVKQWRDDAHPYLQNSVVA